MRGGDAAGEALLLGWRESFVGGWGRGSVCRWCLVHNSNNSVKAPTSPAVSRPSPLHPTALRQVLSEVFAQLLLFAVDLEAIILKPNMIVPGAKGPSAAPAAVAAATRRVLRATVPPAVPGIMFLSGGQSEEEATEHLALINKLGGK